MENQFKPDIKFFYSLNPITKRDSWTYWFFGIGRTPYNQFDLDRDALEEDENISFDLVYDKNFDGYRVLVIHVVRFKDEPIALIRRAGRGAQDKEEVIITNKTSWIEFIKHIAKYIVVDEESIEENLKEDSFDENLAYFYNHEITEKELLSGVSPYGYDNKGLT